MYRERCERMYSDLTCIYILNIRHIHFGVCYLVSKTVHYFVNTLSVTTDDKTENAYSGVQRLF